jgi:hypothetical protein
MYREERDAGFVFTLCRQVDQWIGSFNNLTSARMPVDHSKPTGYFSPMSTAEIIDQVQKLPPADVFELGQWLREYEAGLWDKQIETDIQAGRLDKLGQDALAELRAGKTRPFPE